MTPHQNNNNNVKRSKETFQPNSASGPAADKDAIIADLKVKIEQYQEERRQEMKRVEGHSKKIRDWVASKLLQLETKNAVLQSERDLLEGKLASLTKKLQKLEHRAEADDVDICFTGSEYFHNESPDTDEETQLNDADGARQPLKSAPRAMPEVKIERKVFPKDLALSFLSSCDESQATDVNTSRSSEDETQVLVTPAPTSEFKKVENDSRKNDLMEKFLAMKHDDDDDENHTVSALATMPRCKAGELCVPDYSGTNRSKKMKAIDRNYRSSSVAPQMNPQPPTLPLRRVPSWENRIYEVAKAGLKVDQGLPEVRSFHSRTILFYENGGCGSSNVPVFAVTRKRAIKISDSPFSSHSTDKSRTQKILFDVLTTSPTKSHPRQNAESRPHSSSCAPLTAQPGSILSTSTRENSGLVDKMCANFKSPECDADARVDERKISEVAPRDESSLNLENKTQRQPSSPQMQQQQPNDHHHSHLFSQNIDGVSDPDTGACLELMTQSDTSSDYALPPDDGDSNLGFSCRLQQKETCFVCVGVDSRGRQVKDAAAEAGDDDDDDDSADKWAIFEEEVIKAGFLVHLRRDVKGWCECWCIFTGHDLRIYPIKGEQPLSIVALDGGTKVAQSDNTFVLSTRNMRNTFACNSASSSNSWVQVLSESITWLSADGDVSKNLNGDSCFFKSKNGQIEKCWCILQENLLNFYKTPKSQMPYLKLSLNEFRVEELNSIKSNSSSPKFHSLLALWPSSSSSTTTSSSSSSSSSDPSPIYLHIPDESGKAKEWFQRILKASTCSVLNASKQGTEYEQCVLKLVSADGVPTSSLWKEPILSFSKAPLAKPLISLPSGDLYKRATDMFKHILDFMSLPIDWSDLDIKLNLVQRIFSLCHHHHHLHNELFCQLMKQTTRSHQQQKSLGNFLCGGHHWFLCDTSPTSPLNSTIETTDPKSPTNSSSHPISIQAWQLLTIALHLFLPNRQSILWMLSKHLQRNADSRSECGKYAVYCQSAMERVQLNGPRSHPPSQLEVLSVLSHNPYHHSQPISIPVHLPNSSYQVVSFDGSTLVSEFLANLNSSMDMRDSNSSGFALFACDSNNPQREVCCLDLNAKVCDILSCLQVLLLKLNSKKSPTTPTIKLLYRNRLYMKSLCRFETEKERLLLAFQFHSQLMEGRFPVTEDLALELVALMAQIEYGDVRPTSELKSSSTSSRSSHSPQHQHILISQVLDRFLPKFILDDSEHDREIEKRLVNSWSLLKGRGTEDCVKVYLTVVRKWPLCGTRMLLAKLKVEATSLDDVWFCVHEDGISVLELKSLKPLYSFGYNLINTFGGYDDDYMFIVVKRNAHSPVAYRRFLFAMAKSEAQEVVLLMVDYIKCRNIHKTHEKPPTKDHNSSALQSR